MPVAKETDAEVFAGTINGDGALEIESTKAAEDTTLARIIRMVQEAHGRRAQVEQWVEKFAAVYTPAVIAVALAIFLVPIGRGRCRERGCLQVGIPVGAG